MSVLVVDAEYASKVARYLKAEKAPCLYSYEMLISAQYSHLMLQPVAPPPAAAAAAGTASVGAPRARRCRDCSREAKDHASVGLDDLPTTVAGKRKAEEIGRADLERIVRRPRIYGPADPPEITDISEKPWRHVAGLIAAERTRSAAVLGMYAAAGGAKAAEGEKVTLPKLWLRDVDAMPVANVPAVAAALAMRADGLQLALDAVSAHAAHEFQRVEAASGGRVAVFYPTFKALISRWSSELEAEPPKSGKCRWAELATAVRFGDEAVAEQLYRDLALTEIRKKLSAETEVLKTVGKAAAAGKSGGDGVAKAAGALAGVVPGTDGKVNPKIECLKCRSKGHIMRLCPN